MKEKTAGQSPAYLLSEKENSPPVVLLSAGQLVPFPGHPFRVAEDGELELLMESIREYGVLTPLLARPKGDGSFELISGHRRKMACEKMGIEKIPVLVRELTDEEAVIRMVDSNIQRERVLPSEKAFAYKMKYEALKRKAGRPSKDNPRQVGANFRADEAVAENQSDSARTVQRYIRLTHLIPSILQMVDEGRIAFNPAVEISYLTEEHQYWLKEEMDDCQATPSLTQSRTLKQMSRNGTLTQDYLHHLLTEEKPNQRQKFFLNQEDVAQYFPPNYNAEQMHNTILLLLRTWQSKRGYNKDAARNVRER